MTEMRNQKLIEMAKLHGFEAFENEAGTVDLVMTFSAPADYLELIRVGTMKEMLTALGY